MLLQPVARIFIRMVPKGYAIKRDPNRRTYTDLSLTPVDYDNLEDMEMATPSISTGCVDPT